MNVYVLELFDKQEDEASLEGVFSSWLAAEWAIADVINAWCHGVEGLNLALEKLTKDDFGGTIVWHAGNYDADFYIREVPIDRYPMQPLIVGKEAI